MKPPSAKTSPTTPGAGPAVTARKQADLWTIAPLDMPLSEYWQALQHEWEVMSVSKLEKKKWERNFETAVAECMKGRGFEYFPTVEESDDSEYSESPSSVMMAHLLPVPDLDPERELVVQRGYGVDTARYDKQALEKNKNAQYVRSLSRKSLDRYVEALRGVKPDDESGDDDLPGSCRAIAYETYPDPEDYYNKNSVGDAFEDLIYGGMADMNWRTDDDPRTLLLDRKWQKCMVGKGVPVQEEILTGDSGKSSIESGPILAFRLAERTGANGEAAPTEKYQDYSLPEDQQRLVGTEAERGIAIADFDCRVETDYMRQLVAIQADLEKKFVKSHLTQLNQLMTAIDRNIGR